ncbi:unnamed protein product [Camellia sinensis]
MEWKTQRLWFMKKNPLFYSLFSISIFFSFSALALLGTISTQTTPCLDHITCGMTSTQPDFYIQEFEMFTDKMKGEELIMSKGHKREEVSLSLGRTRRLLSGPGSSPPRCASKCGKCTPCKPVHVPVPPGTPVTAEYYPEAWRCKCGNKLYMP